MFSNLFSTYFSPKDLRCTGQAESFVLFDSSEEAFRQLRFCYDGCESKAGLPLSFQLFRRSDKCIRSFDDCARAQSSNLFARSSNYPKLDPTKFTPCPLAPVD
ncbi:hypothetical protein FGIG_10473 [Fasciola gigantica]|uniref:Uncharacterized protein n=1 Tax=Fasciola gigantica TaxID=46835 RepID=A0A504Z2J9_FASGI|nr:hypothetical protein FGIG_10473 [Fasciola gigantica]